VILDDSFSALDGRTEAEVTDNLLGPEGLFRKTKQTVLWITNSSTNDRDVMLESSTIS